MENERARRPQTLAESIDLSRILFLDIETVPQYPDFDSLPDVFKQLWLNKSRKYSSWEKEKDITPEELYSKWAGIHAEFGKIVCISTGYFHNNPANGSKNFRIKSFFGHDEKQVLEDFAGLLDTYFHDAGRHFLCAHNGIEFDFPFTARRMMINKIRIPALLNVSGSKSWNNKFLLDTMEMWKFGDYKEKTPLNLLAACFGIKSPKDDIDGSQVADVYYNEGDEGLTRIALYCQKDVETIARIFTEFAGAEQVSEEAVIRI